MKLFALTLVANAEKCSEPCDVGTLTDGSVCNIESCSYYDELNHFQNGRMDDASDASWNANGATVSHQAVSYHNGGYLVTGRTASWRGIKQDFTADEVTNMRNKSFNGGMYVRPGSSLPANSAGVRFQLTARITENGEDSFHTLGFVDYASGDDVTEWKQMTGSLTVPSNADALRIYVQATDNTIDFEVDHAFLVDVNDIGIDDDSDQLISNGNFDLGNVGWTALSHPFTLKTGNNPSGEMYAQMASRTNSEHGFKQEINMAKLDGSNFVEVSFWAKLADESDSNTQIQDLAGKIVCQMDSGNEYIQAVNGCGVLSDVWTKYSGVADLRACTNPTMMQLSINRPASGVIIDIDDVSVTNYTRDRSWLGAAQLRTDELRKQATRINVQDERTKTVEIKMTKNAYPFGATINKFMMADEYQRTNWPILFNYGY